MPSAEENHDHDLPRYTRRCSGHHHRWILWTVNAAIRRVQRRRRRRRRRHRHRHRRRRRRCRRTCERETSTASVSKQIGPKTKRSCRTARPFEVYRSPLSSGRDRERNCNHNHASNNVWS
ncbi:hypothetical protein ANTPLA_LOCUS8664 [Anthophora plagiata]